MEDTPFFTDLKTPTAFTSVYKVSKTLGVSKKRARKELLKQDAYKLHHPAPNKFRRRKVFSPMPNWTWGMDLAEIKKYSKSNYNKNYILVVVDFFDRHAWFEPLKTKNTEEVLSAFEKIIDRSGRKPQAIYHDRGREFVSQTWKQFCADNNINQFLTHSVVKCSICERLIRTLFQIISKYMTHHNTKRFVNKITDFEFIYNNSYHRSIKRTPASVNEKNYWEVYYALYGKSSPSPKPKLKVGDQVLKKKDKPVFTKGYTQTFDREIYTVTHVKQTNPPTYLIENKEEGKLKRAYYERELLKID